MFSGTIAKLRKAPISFVIFEKLSSGYFPGVRTPGKYPEDNFSLLQHGESLKTRIRHICLSVHPSIQDGTTGPSLDGFA